MKKPKSGYRYRDSETGQYTTKEDAENNPSTTERERIKKPKLLVS